MVNIFITVFHIVLVRGDTHMTSTSRGGVGELGKNEMLLGVEGWGVIKSSGRPIFIFLLKKIVFAP